MPSLEIAFFSDVLSLVDLLLTVKCREQFNWLSTSLVDGSGHGRTTCSEVFVFRNGKTTTL